MRGDNLKHLLHYLGKLFFGEGNNPKSTEKQRADGFSSIIPTPEALRQRNDKLSTLFRGPFPVLRGWGI